MNLLPTLRVKILKSFLGLVLVYAGFGIFLVSGVFLASQTTPTLIHINYDSIVYARNMRAAWEALSHREEFTEKTSSEWQSIFENALRGEEKNVTEAGERDIALDIRRLWEGTKKNNYSVDRTTYKTLLNRLQDLVRVNENGMFHLAHTNEEIRRRVLLWALLYFGVTLVIAILVADGLANRLARPLKSIAEVLHSRPTLSKKLKLPEPSTLEFLILGTELTRLWDRLSEANKLNIGEILQQKIKLETVLSSIEDALLVLDGNGLVTQANDCLFRLVGLPAHQVIGQMWPDLPSIQENYLKLRGVLTADLVDGKEAELFLDQKKKFYAARWRKIETGNGQVSGIVYLLHDITEKRQRDRLRSEIIDLLSHELKTPLQSLGTASDLLQSQRADFSEDVKLLVDTISEDVDRIRGVAHEFVQVTQSQSRILKITLEKISLRDLVPEWLKPFAVLARDRHLKLCLEKDGDNEFWANVDPIKFPWVISNLLSNAMRLSPPEGRVAVQIRERQGHIEIDVSDEGPGVRSEDRLRIFEPFFQASLPLSEGGRGLFGVGLTIAREVVEAHEGRIECLAGVEGARGSVFRITLPLPA